MFSWVDRNKVHLLIMGHCPLHCAFQFLSPVTVRCRCMVCSTVISIAPVPGKSPEASNSGYPGYGPSGSYGPPPPYVGGKPAFCAVHPW
jgi:hypothetical protein